MSGPLSTGAGAEHDRRLGSASCDAASDDTAGISTLRRVRRYNKGAN